MDVVIIGAGIAGLAAADRLVKAGLEVEILEACEQAGGRIRTSASGIPDCPFELGAEFIHGKDNIVWDYLRQAGIETVPVADRHWTLENSHLRPADSDTSQLGDIFNKFNSHGPDISLAEFLKRANPISNEWLLRQFVEGFYGADTRRVSMKWLVESQMADDETFRVQGGYGRLVEWFQDQISSSGVTIFFNTVVEAIRWRNGKVSLRTQTPEGQRSFHASQALITVPLGVLRAKPGSLGSIHFDPDLDTRAGLISNLEMGRIAKVQLLFSEPFWKQDIGSTNFGFIHSRETRLRTWWSAGDNPMLTGWAYVNGDEIQTNNIAQGALNDLATIFHRRPEKLKSLLRDWRFHDWAADPFTRGAYSYTPVGSIQVPGKIARPLGKKLFFAGEAIVGGAPQGTVHGAICSGLDAADRILQQREAAFAS